MPKKNYHVKNYTEFVNENNTPNIKDKIINSAKAIYSELKDWSSGIRTPSQKNEPTPFTTNSNVGLPKKETTIPSENISSNINDRIMFTYLLNGHKVNQLYGNPNANFKSFDVRGMNEVINKSIETDSSFVTTITRNGIEYKLVGLAFDRNNPTSDVIFKNVSVSGRHGFVFACIENTENLPSNIDEILINEAINSAKAVYSEITDWSDVLKIPNLKKEPNPVANNSKQAINLDDKKADINILSNIKDEIWSSVLYGYGNNSFFEVNTKYNNRKHYGSYFDVRDDDKISNLIDKCRSFLTTTTRTKGSKKIEYKIVGLIFDGRKLSVRDSFHDKPCYIFVLIENTKNLPSNIDEILINEAVDSAKIYFKTGIQNVLDWDDDILKMPNLKNEPNPVTNATTNSKQAINLDNKKADIEKRIVLTGTDDGFTVLNSENYKNVNAGTAHDVRQRVSDDFNEIEYGKGDDKKTLFFNNAGNSYHYFYTIKKRNYQDENINKRYYVVGVTSTTPEYNNGRNGSIFASIEDDGNITDFTRTVLELAIIKEFEKQTKSRSDVFKPLPKEFIDKVNAKYDAELKAL